jgi:hypothetical protein
VDTAIEPDEVVAIGEIEDAVTCLGKVELRVSATRFDVADKRW